MNLREQLIGLLLQACDARDRTIEGLQQEKAALEKKLATYEQVQETAKPNGQDKELRH
jgi:hypothetical protein